MTRPTDDSKHTLGNTPAARCAFPVNTAHQRGIGVTLTLVDTALCRMDEWADGREVRSVLHQEHNNLTRYQRVEIRRTTESIRRLIQEVAQAFDINASVQDAASTIRGECAGVWEPLVEMLATHLKRYGDLPEGLAEYRDPKTEQIIEAIEHIVDVLRTHSVDTSDPPAH